jgi:hypothetical protein
MSIRRIVNLGWVLGWAMLSCVGDDHCTGVEGLTPQVDLQWIRVQSAPIVSFDTLPPVGDVTVDVLAELTRTVERPSSQAAQEAVIEDSSSELQALTGGLNIAESTPAYFNALIGKDLSRPIDIAAVAVILARWREATNGSAKFFFDADVEHVDTTDTTDVANRLIVLDRLVGWWIITSQSPDLLGRFRSDVEEAGLRRRRLSRPKSAPRRRRSEVDDDQLVNVVLQGRWR